MGCKLKAYKSHININSWVTVEVMSVREVAMSGVGVIVRVRTFFSEITESIKRQPLGWCFSLGLVLFILYMFAHILHNTLYWDKARYESAGFRSLNWTKFFVVFVCRRLYHTCT